MGPDLLIITGLLIIIAIQLVIIFFIQKHWKSKYNHLEKRCAKFVNDTDIKILRWQNIASERLAEIKRLKGSLTK